MSSRNGVDQHEIAETLHDLAIYIKDKNIGSEHNKFAEDVLKKGGLADQIDAMDQPALDSLFGEGDAAGYWPGKFRPTLIDLQEGLEFFAYREKIGGGSPLHKA